MSARLLRLMEQKKSNLALAADVTKQSDLLRLADQVGPHIVVLKTHVDIIEDYDESFSRQISELAKKHNFLVFVRNLW